MYQGLGLESFGRVRFTGCENNSTSEVMENILLQISEVAEQRGFPVAFRKDQLSFGRRSVESCLVAYHPEHQHDYSFWLLSFARPGNDVIIELFGGTNREKGVLGNIGKGWRNGKQSLFSSSDAGEAIKSLGSMVGGTLSSMTINRFPSRQEIYWAEEIRDVIREVCGV